MENHPQFQDEPMQVIAGSFIDFKIFMGIVSVYICRTCFLILFFLFKSPICKQSYLRTVGLSHTNNIELRLAISHIVFYSDLCFELLKRIFYYEIVPI